MFFVFKAIGSSSTPNSASSPEGAFRVACAAFFASALFNAICSFRLSFDAGGSGLSSTGFFSVILFLGEGEVCRALGVAGTVSRELPGETGGFGEGALVYRARKEFDDTAGRGDRFIKLYLVVAGV